MTLRRRARALVHGTRLDRELDREVRFHIEMETEKYVQGGMSREEARKRALRNFGAMEKHKEDARDTRSAARIDPMAALRG